jgi:hypothetical protein
MGNRINRRFDYLRSQADQEANAQQQKVGDDINRQAAARGRLGGGVTQKLKAQAGEQLAGQKRTAVEGIESMREQAIGQQEEQEANRAFAAKESALGREFQGGMAREQMEFARGERLGGQDFAAGQAGIQRDFDKGLFDKQMSFNKKAQSLQNTQFKAQLKQSKVLAEKQMELDTWATHFNAKIAQQQANRNPGLLGGGGILGTGIGGRGRIIDTGGGGGGKIICTEYCRQGWISSKVLDGDLEFAHKFIPLQTRLYYLEWAQYVVPAMQKHPVLLYLLWPIAYNWSHYMAWKVGKHDKKPLFGWLTVTICTPISTFIGKTVSLFKRGDQACLSK